MDNNDFSNEPGNAEQNDSLRRRLRVANAAAGVTLMSNRNSNSSDRNGSQTDDAGRNSARGNGKRRSRG